ncbi:MAG TPA: ABC transporter ATP-binding protein [Thermodesulfobacteriota bacterium]|nr:ABC transporter ATP-binding protein [Thermodesulfobacteriota bacterium]
MSEETKSPLLEGKGLTKYFGGLAAVSEVSFQLFRGEILGLIGPNGAGKTTLFNIIAGVYKPNHGQVLFGGRDITGAGPNEICKLGIARTFQITKPFLEMTVLENSLVGAFFGHLRRHVMDEARSRAMSSLQRVGLDGKAEKKAKSLNLVDRKRLEVARALSTAPEVLLLDEVVAGLNPKEAGDMAHFIGTLRDGGITILMIEHVMKAIMGLSDRLVVLNYGKKLTEGKPREVANDPRVIEAYLGKGGKLKTAAREMKTAPENPTA